MPISRKNMFVSTPYPQYEPLAKLLNEYGVSKTLRLDVELCMLANAISGHVNERVLGDALVMVAREAARRVCEEDFVVRAFADDGLSRDETVQRVIDHFVFMIERLRRVTDIQYLHIAAEGLRAYRRLPRFTFPVPGGTKDLINRSKEILARS